MRVLGTCVRVQKAVILQRDILNINIYYYAPMVYLFDALFASVMVQAKGNGMPAKRVRITPEVQK